MVLAATMFSSQLHVHAMDMPNQPAQSIVYVEGQAVTVEETDAYRTAEAQDEKGKYQFILNKKTGSVTVNLLDPQTNEIIKSSTNGAGSYDVEPKYSYPVGVYSYENTLTNYEYKEYRDDTWYMKRPTSVINSKYMHVRPNPKTSKPIETFVNAVEDLNKHEVVLAGSLGTVAFTSFLAGAAGVADVFTGGVMTPAAASALAAALGAYGGAGAAIFVWNEIIEDCYSSYMKVWDNTPDSGRIDL